jgi:NADPH:quinone reductase-like Zn-dependent oxidoreductase
MSDKMHMIYVHEYGDPCVLRYESVERPEPTADELLVRIHGAGLNPADTAGRYGQIEYPLPWIPGWDLSGTVAAVGNSVTDFEVGDSVYGLARFPDAGNAYRSTRRCLRQTSMQNRIPSITPQLQASQWSR